MRGRRLLAEADVVVVDRLAPRELLDDLPADVEVIDCGKSAHRHNLSQDEINAVLVDRARAGKRVVRLKGGDPFVFGRGGEELLACVAAGVPVTVVPGISSALAGARRRPASRSPTAGWPPTSRWCPATSTRAGPADAGLDWPGAGARPARTLVLLMAHGPARPHRARADRARPAADTPAAVVHRATMPGQRMVRAPLAGCRAAVARRGDRGAAVVVVGAGRRRARPGRRGGGGYGPGDGGGPGGRGGR